MLQTEDVESETTSQLNNQKQTNNNRTPSRNSGFAVQSFGNFN